MRATASRDSTRTPLVGFADTATDVLIARSSMIAFSPDAMPRGYTADGEKTSTTRQILGIAPRCLRATTAVGVATLRATTRPQETRTATHILAALLREKEDIGRTTDGGDAWNVTGMEGLAEHVRYRRTPKHQARPHKT